MATFDGYEYRGSLIKMGHHCHFIGLTQAVRSAIGKNPGDMVHVVIRQDTEARKIEVPEEFKTLLDQNPEAQKFFEKLSFTNQKEYVQWITGAKKTETRDRRLPSL
ncbi:MAG: YdeI/OmpD-associated family protein [Bacillota bacterium]